MNLLRHSVPLFLAALFVLVFADAAFAIGDGTVGNFSCSGGKATGQLYTSGASCPTTLGIDNFFSFLICNMEQLASNLMGHMFCGMISSLSPLIWVGATLAIIFFAISFMFGIVPMHGREAIMIVAKIAFFTGFATNADLLVGTGYNLLISGIRDGVTIALQAIGGTVTTGDDLYKLLDEFLAKGFHLATDGLAATESDRAASCKNAVFAVMATMAIAFPMMSYLGLILLGRIVITFFRAVFGYVYALVGITFLMTMSPIFLTFALFKNPVVHQYFDKWVGYMVSFALQIVLLFSFIGFIMTIDIKNPVSSLTDVIMYKTETVEATSIRLPWQYCTLCEFKVVDTTNGTEIKLNGSNSKEFLKNGKLQCKDFSGDPQADASGHKAISLTFGAAPDASNKMNSLIKLAGTGIMSLILLAVLVERLLASIPYLGQKLAGGMGAGAYAPQLGGGGGAQSHAMRMPGETLLGDFNTGFRESYKRPGTASGDGLSAAYRAIKDGASAMVSGRMTAPTGKDGKPVLGEDGKPLQGEQVGSGIANNMRSWLSDPNKLGQ